MPFSSDKSNFVKYLKNNAKNLNVEFKYTSDDYKNYEDLFKWCDIVIDNPPFSLLSKEILPNFHKWGVDYIMISPTLIGNKWIAALAHNSNVLGIRNFTRPDGEIKNVNTIILTNFINSNYGIILKDGCNHVTRWVRFVKGDIYQDCWNKHNVYISISEYLYSKAIRFSLFDPGDMSDWDGDTKFKCAMYHKPVFYTSKDIDKRIKGE